MTNFERTFSGELFAFEVGSPNKTFVVHRKPIEENSDVLETLISNGMQESTTGIARLPDVQPKIFAMFIEFIYTNFYRVVDIPETAGNLWLRVFCYDCKDRHLLPGSESCLPERCLSCGSVQVAIGDIEKKTIVVNRPTEQYPDQEYFTPAYDFLFPRRHSIITDRSASARAFALRQYPALDTYHQDVRLYLAIVFPPDLITRNICVHAQLYVFAHRYRIPKLKALCLHKLHRDLLYLHVDTDSIDRIVELLSFTYENTADNDGAGSDMRDHAGRLPYEWRNEPKLKPRSYIDGDEKYRTLDDDDTAHGKAYAKVSAETVDDLRDEENKRYINAVVGSNATFDKPLRYLVMAYAVANADTLIQYDAFKVLLTAGGELAKDFAVGIMKRL